MKHLFITITIFICLSVAAFGQRESKEVQMRLKSIASAVDVTEAEKKELILSIKKLIDGAKEIRAAKTEHMELELRENSLRYLTEVLIIPDDERYEKWQEEVKRKNSKRKTN